MQKGARLSGCERPRRRPRFGAIFRKISDFLHNFGVVKKCPSLRIEPTVSPIFGRGRDHYARSLFIRRARVFP